MNKLFLIMLLLPFVNAANSLTLSEQRDIYTQATELQEQKKWSEASQKFDVISQYPLTYLLEYQELKANFSAESLPAVQSFLTKYPTHSRSVDLQREYLYYLGKNAHWKELLTFYPRLPNSIDLKCYYYQAQLSQGQSEKIWPDVQKSWLTGGSLPNACDDVLAHYLSTKKIDQNLIWHRFQLSYENNERGMMSYLITLMDDQNEPLAQQLLALNRSPKQLLKSTLFTHRKQPSYVFLVPSIKRLARQDAQSGIKAYQLYQEKIPFTLEDNIQLKKYLISRILITDNDQLMDWLDAELTSLNDDTLTERRIRYAIKLDDWSAIEFWLGQLSSVIKNKGKWQYWQAQVWERQKQQNKADKIYHKLAIHRSYYGFLSAQKIGKKYQLNATVISDKSNKINHLQKQLAHIEELHFHEQISLLKREWRKLLNAHNVELQNQLGLFAYNKGWAHLSVVASINSKSWSALNIRFPATHAELFDFYANKYQLDSTYIYAITRQESAFDEYANSPAGARGYMQLMPQTAKETAKKIGLKNYKRRSQLNDEKINIELGSAYFNGLMKRYQGNRILATAAYNAGPHRVDRWKNTNNENSKEGLSMDSWIETIPYKETRQYVKNVLAYNVIYQHVLNKPMIFMTDKEISARF